jgi:hypothetical protein
MRRSANGSDERSTDTRLGGVVLKGHTELAVYQRTHFQCVLSP